MTTRDIGFIALFAALIVALAYVPAIPLAGGVPITLQSLGVMLAGLILGPKRGALACVVVIALVGLGLPVLGGGRGGVGVYVGPTAGFLFGWVPAAFLTGLLATRFEASAGRLAAALPRRLDEERRIVVARVALAAFAAIVGGILLLYVFGVLWLGLTTENGLLKAFLGSLLFVPGDLIKAVVAALVTVKVRDAFPLERK